MLYMMYIFPFETRAFPKNRQIGTKRNYIRQGILSKGRKRINQEFFKITPKSDSKIVKKRENIEKILRLKPIAHAPNRFNILRLHRITHFNLLTKLFDMHRHRRNIPD